MGHNYTIFFGKKFHSQQKIAFHEQYGTKYCVKNRLLQNATNTQI
jgi:hypothetical protein